MKVSKKILSIILSVIMLLSVMPMTGAFAATTSGTCGENVTWTFDDETGTLTISGEGEMDNYDYYPPWNDLKNNIKTVIIEDGVTNISDTAFYECSNLTSIEIPTGVVSIGYEAFYYCSSLTNIEIPDGTIKICKEAFSGCRSLASIKIPDSVTSIGSGAFSGCKSLTSIKIPDNITTIGEDMLCGCSSLTNIEIPNSVTVIVDGAFLGCSSLTSIEIPDSVTIIGGGAFSGCRSLTSVEIPESVTKIDSGAFGGCENLKDIFINNSDCNVYFDEYTIPIKTFIHCEHKSIAYEYAKIYARQVVFTDDHTLETEFTMPSTCTSYGFKTVKCKYCDYKANEAVAPTSHIDSDNNGVCDICLVQMSGGTAPGHVHSYVPSVTTTPTCKTSGERTFTCSCGENYTEIIPATGHSDADNDNFCDYCGESLSGNAGSGDNGSSANKSIEFIKMILDWVRLLFIKK